MMQFNSVLPSLFVSLTLAIAPHSARAADTVPKVVTDIAPVQSLASIVLQGLGTPTSIISPQQDPHTADLRPSQAAALQSADLVIWMGPALSPRLSKPIATLASQAAQVSLLDHPATHLLPYREADGHEDEHDDGHDDDHNDAHNDGHDDDRNDAHNDDHDDHGDGHDSAHSDDHGDDHGDGHSDDHGEEHDDAHNDAYDDNGENHHEHVGHNDPHAWLDPENGRIWLGVIADLLAAQDPANAARYRANALAGQAMLSGLQSELADKVKPMHGRNYVSDHDAYQYFEARFTLSPVGAVSNSDATNPGPARLSQLRQALSETDAYCVFSAPNTNTNLLNAVTGQDNLKIFTLDPIGQTLEPGPKLYPTLLRNMADAFADCAKGASD